MPLKRELLKIVRAELGKRNLSDVEFARRVGWTQSRMSRALNAAKLLRVDDLEILLSALQVDSSVIVRAVSATLGTGVASDPLTQIPQESYKGQLVNLLIVQLIQELKRSSAGSEGT